MNFLILGLIVIALCLIDWLFIDKIFQKLSLRALLIRLYTSVLFGTCYLVLVILYITSPNKIDQSIDLPVHKIDGCNIVIYHYNNESYVRKITKEHAVFEIYKRGPYYGLYDPFTRTNLREYD